MAKAKELNKDAWQAYQQSRYRDAVLLWLQASDKSRGLSNAADWYKYRVWAADALAETQQYVKAMDLLMEVRIHEPPDRPNYEAWLAQKRLIDIVKYTQPQHERLQSYLKELRQMANQQKVPAGDLPFLEGQLLDLQGRFSEACKAYEKVWSTHDGDGYVKFEVAFQAAKICLPLRQFKAAKDWQRACLGTKENYQGRFIRAAQVKLRIALAETNWTALRTLLSQYDDAGAGIQDDDYQNSLNHLGCLVHLLDQAALDPMLASHPAQQNLLRPLLDRKNVHTQFNYRLLVLDFRLAALRFVVGVAAVDDMYYAQPQQVPAKQTAKFDRKQYQHRLQRALASCKQAECYGRRIDSLLQCEYRQQEVAKRRQRIEEISEYVSTMEGKSNGN